MRIYQKRTTSSSSHYPSDLAWKRERLPHNHSSESPHSLPSFLPSIPPPFNAQKPSLSYRLHTKPHPARPRYPHHTIQQSTEWLMCVPTGRKRVEKYVIEKMVPMLSLARVPQPHVYTKQQPVILHGIGIANSIYLDPSSE